MSALSSDEPLDALQSPRPRRASTHSDQQRLLA